MADTICLLGDSVAKGIVCTEPGGRYTHSPCAFLRRICEEASLTLLDHARFGCTLSKAQALAGRLSSEFAGSRATLILLGGNDCDYDWSAIAAAPAADHACCTPLPVFESGYISLVSRIQKEGGRPVLLSMVPVLGRRYYRWITARYGEAGIREYLMHFEHIEHWNELYNLSLYRIAAACRVPLVDLRSALLCRRDIGSFYCADGIHPNEAGHSLLYEHCRQQLLQAIAAQPALPRGTA